MNLNDPRHPWARLTVAARQQQDERDASAPYGFATRVTALAFSSELKVASLFDRLALRAFGVAALLALGSVALNYNSITTATTPVSAETVAAASDELILPPTDVDVVAMVFEIAD
jgi:hypothetical protein